jgi:hypothetical protein
VPALLLAASPWGPAAATNGHTTNGHN